MTKEKVFTKQEIEELLKKESAYEKISADSEIVSTEEAQAKAIINLSESKNPEVMSHLSDSEIKYLSSLATISEIYKIDFLQTWIMKFLRLRISMNREGRKEIVEIAKVKQALPNLFPMSRLNR